MSEINEVKETKSRKPLYIGASVATAIALAIGGFAISVNTHAAPDAAPAVTATATASADPSVTPVVTGTAQPTSEYKGMQEATQADKDRIMGAFYGSPLGVDITEVFDNRLADDVLTSFPQEQFKTKEGVLSALNTYQQLTSIQNWTRARNGADDTTLITPFAVATPKTAAFDSAFMDKMKARIAKEGQFAHIPTVAPKDGTLMIDGVVYHTDENSVMTSKSNQPAISVGQYEKEVVKDGVATTEKVTTLHTEGRRYMTINFTGGMTLIAERGYFMDEVPDGSNGAWMLVNFGETYKKDYDILKVVPNAEAQAWYTKAGSNG
jgi:hypothetical protein